MRKLFKILLILTFCITLSACTKPTTKKTKVVFWTLQLSEFSEYINFVINDFEKQNPNVKIKWVDIPFAEGEKRALASILSDNPPDIINLNPSFAYVLASKKTLVNFNNYLKEEKDFYINEALEVNSQNGILFGIPWYLTTPITIYNKEILECANFKAPPKCFDEIQSFSCAIKKLDKTSFMPNLSEDGKALKVLSQINPDAFGVNEINLLDKNNIEIYKLFHFLYQNNLIPKESITQGHRESLDKFQSSEIAFIQTGANFLNIIKENSPSLYNNIGIASQITGDNGKFTFSCMNLVIPKKSQQKQEALKFILYLTNHNNQVEFCKLAPILPANKVALKNSYFNFDKTLEDKARKISTKQLQNLAKPLNITKNKKEIFKIVDDSIQELLLKEEFDIEILEKAQEKIDYLLE